MTTRRIGVAERPATAEVAYIDPPRTWGVRGVDGPIQGQCDVTAEPLADNRSRLIIAINFDGPVEPSGPPSPDKTPNGYRPVMHIRRLADAATYERDGLQSHVLLDAGDFGSERLVVTWVVVPPGGGQRPHVHDVSEQVYIIVRGRGMMTVGDEQAEVEVGDLELAPIGD